MTIEELAKELGIDTEETKDKFAILKKEFNAKAKENTTLSKKLEKLEAENTSSKDILEKFDIVKKSFNLDMEKDDFDAMLDDIKDNLSKGSGNSVTPDELKELKRELAKVTRERDKSVTSLAELNKQLTDEKNQRIKNNVRAEVRKALDTNKIIKPEQTIDLFTNRVVVDEDGTTFTIKGDDGSEFSISDYMADWAKDNPEFVKADTKGGTGSGGNGTLDKSKLQGGTDKFMEKLIANHKPETNNKSISEVFG